MLLLDVETRLRCREVARAWRDALAQRRLWARLDFLACTLGRDSDTVEAFARLLRAACACAGDALHTLKLGSKLNVELQHVVLELVTAHAGSLREVQLVYDCFSVDQLLAILGAAPSLRKLHTCVSRLADVHLLTAMLRGVPPWAPLCVHSISMDFSLGNTLNELHSLFGAMAGHEPLQKFAFNGQVLHEPAALRGLFDAVIQGRLHSLDVRHFDLGLSAAPELARLLRDGALKELHLCGNRGVVLPKAEASHLVPALANNRREVLHLQNFRFWDALDTSGAHVRALAGKPTLRSLALDGMHAPNASFAPVIGAALAALVAADGALKNLELRNSWLGDAGLRPLVEALPHNTHIKRLDIRGTGMSDAFQRDVLVLAVLANASLTDVEGLHCGIPSTAVINAILATRERDSEVEQWREMRWHIL